MAAKSGKKEGVELKREVSAYKRIRILEEASRLFFERGYDATTLDMVAERLGITKPFIYSYYKNKGELLSEICEAGIRGCLAALDGALAAKASPSVRLKRVAEQVARVIVERQQQIVVYQREEKNLAPPDARRIRKQRHEFDTRLAALLEEGAKAGEFQVEDAVLTATWIGGALTWIANVYNPDGKISASELIVHAIRMVMKLAGARLR